MINNMITEIVESIKHDFTTLWTMRVRGETVELITPYSTLAGELVSVFLTQRNEEFIVSDGGFLLECASQQEIKLSERKFHEVDLVQQFHVKSTGRYYYKKTINANILSSYIYDIAMFQTSIANAIYHETLFDAQESKEAKYFAKRINDLLKTKIDHSDKDLSERFELYKDEGMKLCRFPTGIRKIGTSQIWLAMAIYRSNLQNYQRSVYRAEFGFTHVHEAMSGNPGNVNLGMVVDDLPRTLQGNKEAEFLDGVMKGWGSSYDVSSYSFEDIQNLPSVKSLFKIAS